MEWSTILAHPCLTCSFNWGNIERTNSMKICVWCLCMYAVFYVCAGIGFVDWLEKGFTFEKSSEVCICLWQNLIIPRWPCAVDRTLKLSYYHLGTGLTLWLCVCVGNEEKDVKCNTVVYVLIQVEFYHSLNSAHFSWPYCFVPCALAAV